jgi:hypothetical protein
MQRRTTLWIFGIVGAVLLCFGGYRLVQYGSALQDALHCDVAIKQHIVSPHHRRVLVVFEKNCGATTPFNTQVSIATPTRPFSPDAFPSFLSLKEQHALAIRWLDDETVQIEIPAGVEVFRQEHHTNGVTVLYRPSL